MPCPENNNDEDNVGVHVQHCCALHGCKYNDKDCPVVTDMVEQAYICEECEHQNIENVKVVGLHIRHPYYQNCLNAYHDLTLAHGLCTPDTDPNSNAKFEIRQIMTSLEEFMRTLT